MVFGLGALFIDGAVSATRTTSAESPPTPSRTQENRTARAATNQNERDTVRVPGGDLAGGPVIDSGLPFGMQVDTYAESTIKSLLQEREVLREEIAQQKKAYEDLERRICQTAVSDISLPAEVALRLKRLDNDVERYQAENKDLRDKLRTAEREITDLQDEITGQKSKLKGADKKVRSAKEVAGSTVALMTDFIIKDRQMTTPVIYVGNWRLLFKTPSLSKPSTFTPTSTPPPPLLHRASHLLH